VEPISGGCHIQDLAISISYFFDSGCLIRTIADMQYHNYKMTPIEIAYNVFSFVVAVVITIGFTIYAKRALNDLQMQEDGSDTGTFQLEKLPHDKPRLNVLSRIDV
jgi:hypothetical protein